MQKVNNDLKQVKKDIVKHINSIIELVETIGTSRETSLVKTKLEEAYMWSCLAINKIKNA